MARKSDRPVIRPDTCSKCCHGTPVPVMKGNPKVVYCNFSTNVLLRIANEIVIMRFDYGILHTY